MRQRTLDVPGETRPDPLPRRHRLAAGIPQRQRRLRLIGYVLATTSITSRDLVGTRAEHQGSLHRCLRGRCCSAARLSAEIVEPSGNVRLGKTAGAGVESAEDVRPERGDAAAAWSDIIEAATPDRGREAAVAEVTSAENIRSAAAEPTASRRRVEAAKDIRRRDAAVAVVLPAENVSTRSQRLLSLGS